MSKDRAALSGLFLFFSVVFCCFTWEKTYSLFSLLVWPFNIFKFLGKKPRQLMRVLRGRSREKKKKKYIKIVCEIFIHMKMKNPKIFKLPQLLKNSSRNSTVSGHVIVFHVIHVSSTLSYPHNKKVTFSQTFRYLSNSTDPVRLILITFPPFNGFSVCYS